MPSHETSVRAEWDKYRKTRRNYLHDEHSFNAGYAAGMARMREMAAQVAEDRFAENADSRYYEICSQKAEAIRKLGAADDRA